MNEINTPQSPLYDTALEQQILGAMLSGTADMRLLADVPPAAFHDPLHQKIFDATKAKIEEDGVASPATMRFIVQSWPGLSAVGGPEYLVTLAASSIASHAVEDYVKQLVRLYARRSASEALSEGIERLKKYRDGESPEAILSDVEGAVSAAASMVQREPLTQTFLSAMTSGLRSVAEARSAGHAIGARTGIDALDSKVGAMGIGDLVILGGRPGMGKSALALSIATNVARRGEGVFFASLEMYSDSIMQRMISSEAMRNGHRVPYSDMRNGQISDAQLRAVAEIGRQMQDAPILICPPNNRSLSRLRAAVDDGAKRLTAMQRPMGLIVIDYLQLVEVTGNDKSQNYRIQEASRALKSMALKYSCPVLALAQLSRSVEMRDPAIPMLSDLRDSGSIEQDADIVLFCYRASYYLEKKLEAAQQSGRDGDIADAEAALAATRNKMTVYVAKMRHGSTGSATLYADMATNTICDFHDIPQAQDERQYA